MAGAESHLIGGRQALGEGVDPGAVLGELLLVLERCHLELVVHGGELRHQRLLPLAGPQSLLLHLLVQTQYFGLKRPVADFKRLQAAVAVRSLLLVGEHQTAALLADAHGSVVAALSHVRVHVLQVQHFAASLIPALSGRVIAHLGVLRKMLQLHHFLAAPGMVVTLYVQLENEVSQRQDVVQLLGGDPLALDGAAALLNDPRQHAGSAEDVTARSRQRILQNFVTQVAFKIWVHGTLEAIQLKSHVYNSCRWQRNRHRREQDLSQRVIGSMCTVRLSLLTRLIA